MGRKFTVVKYELFNVLRSKWLYVYTLLLALSTFGFSHISDDANKTELALISVLSVVIPLVAILFTTTYWYNSDNFTQLLLSQPVSRRLLFLSRIIALVFSLSACILLGLIVTCLLAGIRDDGVIWLFVAGIFLSATYCFLGALIATYINDRMWGIGLGLAAWFYTVAIHDAMLLIMLLSFRDYPMDLWSAIVCALNPIGLTRVTLLMHFDAPLLLGHSGALVRNIIEGQSGYLYVIAIILTWLAIPALLAKRKFLRRDF